MSRSPLVEQLGLEPHVEGGYYRELWRSEHVLPQSLLGAPYGGARASVSSIYFLLHPGEISAWHVIASAELWLYHLGSPLTLTLGGCGETPDAGADEPLRLGPDIVLGERPQQLVPPGVWQTAQNTGSEATLVSCIVSPAFHEQEFRLLSG